MKILFKILKYGIVIYLLIYFKNLYSETFTDSAVITMRTPDIIGIREIQGTIDDSLPFAKQLDLFNLNNQEELKNHIKSHYHHSNDIAI
jgi:capsule polysaccharide export protein KpsE/RkpR